MPFALFKTTLGHYGVKNTESGKVHSKDTTKQKAQAQMRLLNAIEFGGLKPRKEKK